MTKLKELKTIGRHVIEPYRHEFEGVFRRHFNHDLVVISTKMHDKRRFVGVGVDYDKIRINYGRNPAFVLLDNPNFVDVARGLIGEALESDKVPAIIAYGGGYYDYVGDLIKSGEESALRRHRGGQTWLHLFVKSGRLDLCELVLDKGVGINVPDRNGNTAIDYALRGGNKKIIDFLKSRGAVIFKRIWR